MAVVLVPGVAQVNITGLISGNPWAMVHHWRQGTTTSAFTLAQLQTLADAVFNEMNTTMSSSTCSNVQTLQAEAVDIGSATGLNALSTGTAFVGGQAPSLTNAACYLFNFGIASRYRGGHPRCYYPGVPPGSTTDGEHITPSVAASMATKFVNWVSGVVTTCTAGGWSSPNHCVPRYTYTYVDDTTHHKYLAHRSGVLGVFTVANYTCNGKIGTQRRRISA